MCNLPALEHDDVRKRIKIINLKEDILDVYYLLLPSSKTHDFNTDDIVPYLTIRSNDNNLM